MIRKRKIRKDQLVQRRAIDSLDSQSVPSNTDAAGSADVAGSADGRGAARHSSVHQLKEQMRLRRDLTVLKSRGMAVSSDGLRNDLLDASRRKGDENDDGIVGSGSMGPILMTSEITRGGLTVSSSEKKGGEKSLIERHMDEYIEREMERRGLISERTLADRRERDEQERKMRENLNKSSEFEALREDELYEVPEHLKPRSFLFREDDNDSGDGGGGGEDGEQQQTGEDTTTLQVLGGIAEVDLPIEYKLRNIEETERAKRLAEERKRKMRSGTHSAETSADADDGGDAAVAAAEGVDLLPANMTKDYSARYAGRYMINTSTAGRGGRTATTSAYQGGAHSRAHVHGEGGPRDGGRQRHRTFETASDDRVFERFKKKMRNRF